MKHWAMHCSLPRAVHRGFSGPCLACSSACVSRFLPAGWPRLPVPRAPLHRPHNESGADGRLAARARASPGAAGERWGWHGASAACGASLCDLGLGCSRFPHIAQLKQPVQGSPLHPLHHGTELLPAPWNASPAPNNPLRLMLPIPPLLHVGASGADAAGAGGSGP